MIKMMPTGGAHSGRVYATPCSAEALCRLAARAPLLDAQEPQSDQTRIVVPKNPPTMLARGCPVDNMRSIAMGSNDRKQELGLILTAIARPACTVDS